MSKEKRYEKHSRDGKTFWRNFDLEGFFKDVDDAGNILRKSETKADNVERV